MSTEEFTLDASDIRTYFNKNIIKGRRQYGEYRITTSFGRILEKSFKLIVG
jgi:hypothetical protein